MMWLDEHQKTYISAYCMQSEYFFNIGQWMKLLLFLLCVYANARQVMQ